MMSSTGDGDLGSFAQRLRDSTAAEMKRYQRETEDGLNRCLTSMKVQCEESSREKERLARENTQLQDLVRQLKKRNGELDAEVNN